VILDNLHYFSKDDMIEQNIFGFPNLFTLCITEKVTKKLLEQFKPTDSDISTMVDKLGRNIYSYCAQFGMYDMIPKENITYDFILRIIINTKSDLQLKKYLDKIIIDCYRSLLHSQNRFRRQRGNNALPTGRRDRQCRLSSRWSDV
jgi:hypothetical protein